MKDLVFNSLGKYAVCLLIIDRLKLGNCLIKLINIVLILFINVIGIIFVVILRKCSYFNYRKIK